MILSLAFISLGAAVEFNYLDQDEWLEFPGSQCGGMRQSPINIDTDDTEENDDLISLKFPQWNMRVDGEFENKATNVEFVPDELKATFVNNFGTYVVQQFHLHWGKDDTEGSEHRVDNTQSAAEIHFVTLKEGASPTGTAGDTYAVVAVLCEAADIAVSGIWDKLSPIPTTFESSNPVCDIEYDELLPSNRDYYQYEGSFTTPLCNETAQWFVMKNTIDVPKDFLADLRKVERDASGSLLTFNFRDGQSLNGREVFEFESDDDDDSDDSDDCSDD